jgi:hypothetical protein
MPKPVFPVPSRPISTHLRIRVKRFPRLEVRESSIAGLGLFADQPIRKGALITEYGGRLVGRAEAEQLRLRGEDTHLRAVILGFQALDSRVQGPIFTPQYYTENHLAAGFANEQPAAKNAEYVNENGVGRLHPYSDYAVAGDRVYLKALRNIEPGEEILTDYGRTYRRLHIPQ